MKVSDRFNDMVETIQKERGIKDGEPSYSYEEIRSVMDEAHSRIRWEDVERGMAPADWSQTLETYTERRHSNRGGSEEYRAGVHLIVGSESAVIERCGSSYEKAEVNLLTALRVMGFKGPHKNGGWIDVYEPREEYYKRVDEAIALLKDVQESLDVLDSILPQGTVARGTVDGVLAMNGGLKGTVEKIREKGAGL